jgi:hypothetical protein
MALQAIDRNLKFWHVAPAFLAAFASAMAMWSWALPRMKELTENKDFKVNSCEAPCLFDARPRGYSFDEAKAYLDALGPQARVYYAEWWVPVYDLAWPVTLFIFGILFCLWMTQPHRRFAVHLRPMWRFPILLFPIALFAFDIVENLSVLSMLKAYPQQDRSLVEFASIFSRAKWIAAYLAMGLGAALLALATIGLFRRS